MNKKIKGYELMKLIAEGQIKDGQKFLYMKKGGISPIEIYWNGRNFIYCNTEKFVLKYEEEIGISRLEKEKVLEENPAKFRYDLKYYYDKEKMGDKINEIIDKVNKLDKKINKE